MKKYNDLATEILFTGKIDLDKNSVVYRKGKVQMDVAKAWVKACRFGMCKTEYELSLFALYLEAIFKAKR